MITLARPLNSQVVFLTLKNIRISARMRPIIILFFVRPLAPGMGSKATKVVLL